MGPSTDLSIDRAMGAEPTWPAFYSELCEVMVPCIVGLPEDVKGDIALLCRDADFLWSADLQATVLAGRKRPTDVAKEALTIAFMNLKKSLSEEPLIVRSHSAEDSHASRRAKQAMFERLSLNAPKAVVKGLALLLIPVD